ncbi:uncharacterized protein LOC132282046 [Cornus florida]|uniref:uncharacterized protein LOC132282046 n=1 Tax=Cornus florida TaxID=4283 RepID=UPI00289AB5E5|nr:uncharacterized protein LOC132282046 [Cornus florida]
MSNEVLLPFILLLISTSVFSQKSVAFGSPDREQNFTRPDPLSHFKLYKGVYDLENKHYWASTVFVGVHGYAISGVWMLCGLGFGSYLIFKNCCGSSSPITHYSDCSFITMLLLVVLFSLLAIVASSLVIVANRRTFHRTRKVKETIVGAVGDARETIQRVTSTMEDMQNLLGPYDPHTIVLLHSTASGLGRESQMIQQFVRKKERLIDKAIQASYIVHLVVVIVNLVLLVAALVLLLLHWHSGFIIIIFFCWILTTLCWVLTGFNFFFHTFAEDTCSALEDFGENPQNNSLSSLVPCVSSTDSDKLLVKIGYTVHSFMGEVLS